MANAKLEMILTAHDRASAAFNSAARSADRLAKSQDHVNRSGKNANSVMKGLTKLGAAVSLGAAGLAVKKFASDSIKTYQNVAKETLGLQRVMGGTAEEMSALRGAAKLSGIDMGQFGKSMGFLSKQMANNGKGLAAIGVSAKDATGKMRPTAAVLKDVANWFNKAEPGAQRTAAALAIFGKSGAALLPFLSKGAKGIEELEGKTRKYGLVLSGKQLDNVKAQTKAQRELGMAMEGTKLQFGAAMAPVMTKLNTSLANMLPKLTKGLTPAFTALGMAANTMVGELDQRMPAIEAGATKLGSKIGDVAKAFQSNWPEIRSTIENVAKGLERAGQFAQTLWGAFKSLPPEVQTALATLAVLQKTGALNVAFKGFDMAKGLFQSLMHINAGTVIVNGAVKGGVPTPGGKGTPVAPVGNPSMLGRLATALGFSGPGMMLGVPAAILAGGTALHWAAKADEKTIAQGANRANIGGTYGAMGAGSGYSSPERDASLNRLALERRQNYPEWLKNLMGGDTASGQPRTYGRSAQQAERYLQGKTAGEAPTAGNYGRSAQQAERYNAGRTKAVTAVANQVATFSIKTIGAKEATAQVGSFAARLLKIPKEKVTKVAAAGAAAAGSAVGSFAARLLGVPAKKSTTVTAPGAAAAAVAMGVARLAASRIPAKKSTTVTAPGVVGAAAGHRMVTAAANTIPRAKATNVTAPGAVQSTAQHFGVTWAANTIPGWKSTAVSAETAQATSALQQVGYWLGTLQNKTVYVTTVMQTVQGSVNIARALGGMVRGPGTDTSDSIPALLSDGEFVMRAAAVRKYGLGKMHAMNAMRLAVGGLATGGEEKYKADWGDFWLTKERTNWEAGFRARNPRKKNQSVADWMEEAHQRWRWQLAHDNIPMSPQVKSKFDQDFGEWKNRNDQQAGLARDAYSGFTGGLREFGGLSGMAGAVKDFREAQSAVANASSPAERKAAQARVKELEGSTNPQGWLAGKVEKIRKLGSMLTALKEKGVAAGLLAEVAKAGPEDGLALGQAIMSSSIADLNLLNAQLNDASALVGWEQFNNANAAQGQANLVQDQIFQRSFSDGSMVQLSADFYLDGKALHESLIRLRRQRGMAGLGLG